jgi:hypothetical protein
MDCIARPRAHTLPQQPSTPVCLKTALLRKSQCRNGMNIRKTNNYKDLWIVYYRQGKM